MPATPDSPPPAPPPPPPPPTVPTPPVPAPPPPSLTAALFDPHAAISTSSPNTNRIGGRYHMPCGPSVSWLSGGQFVESGDLDLQALLRILELPTVSA